MHLLTFLKIVALYSHHLASHVTDLWGGVDVASIHYCCKFLLAIGWINEHNASD